MGLAESKACVAVIGRRWADATNLLRLQVPNDMGHHELETALASGDQEVLTVIPLLVEEAQLAQIRADQRPESLRPLLADWNVLALSEGGWDHYTRRLIEAIAAATGMPVNPELEEWMALAPLANDDTLLAEASFEQDVEASQLTACPSPGHGLGRVGLWHGCRAWRRTALAGAGGD